MSPNRALGALIISLWVTCFLFAFGRIGALYAIVIVILIAIVIYAVTIFEKAPVTPARTPRESEK